MAKREYTDEERAAAAERMRKARAKKKEQEAAEKEKQASEVKFSEETVRKMIEEALEKQRAELMKQQAPQIVQIQQDVEKVELLWQAPVADYNVIDIGDNGMYGRITGKTGIAYVPKSDLSRVLDERMRFYIDNRWMIVVSGLTDEERDALHCRYTDGEVLNRNSFQDIEKIGVKLLDIFPKLCRQHKEMVAQRLVESYINGNPNHIKRETVIALNDMSKTEFENGLFVGLIERMNNDELKK